MLWRSAEGISYSNADDRPCQITPLSGTQRIPAGILHVPQRSVNRKVQGSNPCSGANFEFEFSLKRARQIESCSSFVAICSNWQIGTLGDPVDFSNPVQR